MKELFAEITDVNPKLQGWCDLDKAFALAAAVITLRPAIVTEIGVWGARSLIPMAQACKAIGAGKVIGIDPWNAEISAKAYEGENRAWWLKVDHEAIYLGAMQAIESLGLTPFVEIIRKTSDEVIPPAVIDLLHIDGSHSDQAFTDSKRYGPRVRVGGLCFCDDIGWEGGGPARGVAWLKENGFIELYRCGPGAMFQRCN